MQVATRAIRITRRWWLYGLMVLGALLGFAGMVLLAMGHLSIEGGSNLYLMLIPILAITCPLLLLTLHVTKALPKKTEGTLEITPSGLSFNGRHLMNLASIQHADHVKSQQVEAHLEVVRRGPTLRFQLLEPVVERTLLYAMGCDVSQATATYTGLSRVMTSTFGNLLTVPSSLAAVICAGIVISGLVGPAISPFGVVVAAITGLVAMAGIVVSVARMTVQVSADGLAASWLHKSWSIEASQIVGVSSRTFGGTAQGGGWDLVEVHLHDRSSFTIPMRKNGARAAALHRRIELMLEHHRETSSAGPAMLQQGQRPVHEWFRSLRAAGHGVHQHRVAPIDTNQLWDVIGRQDAPAADRVASAIALRSQLDQGARTHLQRIAVATSEPRVRVVLDALAEGRETDEELLAALEAVAGARQA